MENKLNKFASLGTSDDTLQQGVLDAVNGGGTDASNFLYIPLIQAAGFLNG